MNDKKILLDAVKEVGLLAPAKLAWVVHPLLEEMAAKFAGYVGPYSLTQNGRPLLQTCIKTAFGHYKREMDANNERAAVAGFAKALLDSSRDVFAQQLVVETSQGDIQWMPFVCGAEEFLARFKNPKVANARVESNISDNIAQAFMMIKIVPHSLLDTQSLGELFNDMKVLS